jgi:hypothetical protein
MEQLRTVCFASAHTVNITTGKKNVNLQAGEGFKKSRAFFSLIACPEVNVAAAKNTPEN